MKNKIKATGSTLLVANGFRKHYERFYNGLHYTQKLVNMTKCRHSPHSVNNALGGNILAHVVFGRQRKEKAAALSCNGECENSDFLELLKLTFFKVLG